MTRDHSQAILIVGAGAWGLSSAYHLLNEGYTNITVLDKASEIPSRYSAGYDLNKIVRPEYEDPFYTDLALEAIKGWKTPLFGPYYHHCGYVVATTGKAPAAATKHLQAALSSIKNHPVFKSSITALNTPQSFRDLFWQFRGHLNGFSGYLNRNAGYAHSADAMRGLYEHLARRGIRFILGQANGKVDELLFENPSSGRRCVGVRTADNVKHRADKVICALGAYQAELIPNIANFVVAKSWSVAHVQLTESECNLLRGIPVLNVRDLGFFFEPDPATKLFKLCPLGGGYINTDNRTGASLPPLDALPPPQDYIPAEDEAKLRRLLRETLPELADRPFVDQKMCWFADTKDSEYCVDFVPNTNNSVIVLSGDSGHGFKMMPIVGKWVNDLLKDGEQKLKRWRWKEGSGKPVSQWSDAVSWREGKVREIQEIVNEQSRMVKARL